MIKCPKCKKENEDTALRCIHCDEWLIFYEFKSIEKADDKPKDKKTRKKDVFLPDELVDDEIKAEMNAAESILQDSDITEMITPDDASVQKAFSPECPNCKGNVKTYEIRCRHCGILLSEKIEQAKRLKPYWEEKFRKHLLQDGNYDDVLLKEPRHFLLRKKKEKGSKLLYYLVISVIFFILFSWLFLQCASGNIGG